MKYFESAAASIGDNLCKLLMSAADEVKQNATEISLRSGRCICINTPAQTLFGSKSGIWRGEVASDMYVPSQTELEDCLLRMCGYSLHTHQYQIEQGYLTVAGGHRAGLCGSAVFDASGKRIGLKDITAIRLRIARPLFAIGSQFYELLINKRSGLPNSLLVAGAPGCGKTTLLRDFADYLGGGRAGRYYNVTVADERGELAAKFGSESILSGLCCDVLDGIAKAEAIMQAVRGLRPHAVICDEIGDLDEANAICRSVNSGISVMASMHAASLSELRARPQLRVLASNRVFAKCVLIKGYGEDGYRFELIPPDELC